MKLILTQDVAEPRRPRRRRRGRQRLRPQLPRARRAWRSSPPRAPRSRSRRSAGPARSARSATSATPRRSRRSSPACTVKLPARSGDGGRLFGSVTAADVVEAVSRPPAARSSTAAWSRCPSPIKSLGSHTVTVKVHPEVSATLTVDVVAAK